MTFSSPLRAGALLILAAGRLVAAEPLGRPLFQGDALAAEWPSRGPGEVRRLPPDAGFDVLQLESTAPGQEIGVSRTVALLPEARALVLRAQARPGDVAPGEKAWHTARLRLDFQDATGARLGESYQIDRIQGTSTDWQTFTGQFPVPTGATQAEIALELYLVKRGKVDFTRVEAFELNESQANAWRVEADARIERHRKANLAVEVVDAAGQPIPGAEISVRMIRHAYPFGSAVVAKKLTEEPTTQAQRNYRETALSFFNYVTLENDLKQGHIEKKGIGPAIEALGLLQARGIKARGHVLTWPSWKQSAPGLVALKEDPAAVEAWLDRHFEETLSATAGLITDWDVVNEPAVHHDLIDLLGREKMVDWFRRARRGAPAAALYLNENNLEFGGGNQENLAGWVRFLQERGAPLNGLGWQGHMWKRVLPSGNGILADLDRFAPFGLKIQITEYDCNDRFSDAEEARFLGEFLPAWFSHPSTAGFIMWGFQDDHIWTKNAPLFARDWSLKPAGKVWMDLVYNQWWSDADGLTDTAGRFATRAFLGDYAVQVRHQGRAETVRTTLGADHSLKVMLTETSPAPETLPEYNPYRGSKLPKIIEIPRETSKPVQTVGLTPIGSARVKSAVYVRYQLPPQFPGEVTSAKLRIPARAESFRLYALSSRFVPGEGELDENWSADDITEANAPGLDPREGPRIGDASALDLGVITGQFDSAAGMTTFEAVELAKALPNYVGKSLTLILEADTVDPPAFTPELSIAFQ